jgi:CRP-like cAMP-binding protein
MKLREGVSGWIVYREKFSAIRLRRHSRSLRLGQHVVDLLNKFQQFLWILFLWGRFAEFAPVPLSVVRHDSTPRQLQECTNGSHLAILVPDMARQKSRPVRDLEVYCVFRRAKFALVLAGLVRLASLLPPPFDWWHQKSQPTVIGLTVRNVRAAYHITMDGDARPQRLLCLLPAEARTRLDSLKSTKLYPPRAVLFQQGEPADRIFILGQGKVRLSMRSDRGDQLPMWIAKPGEILGLSACVAGGCYEGTAETMEDADATVVPREAFLDFLRNEQLACFQVLTLLCDQLHVAHEKVRWMASLSSGNTLARSANHPNKKCGKGNGLALTSKNWHPTLRRYRVPNAEHQKERPHGSLLARPSWLLHPGVDLVPFWTMAVANVYRKSKQIVVTAEESREQHPALKGLTKSFVSPESDRVFRLVVAAIANASNAAIQTVLTAP